MLVGQAWAQNYDFSAVCSSGQRLYYKITSDTEPYTVAVTYPQKSYPYYSESSKPKGSVIIPENVSNNEIEFAVTSIDKYAFFQCDSLISVTIPNSVTNIGRAAFDACHCLESANIPDGVTKIEDYTFAYCSRLTSITIPDGVTQIVGDAFRNCYSLASLVVPNSVTKIGSKAFSYIKNVIYAGSATYSSDWEEINLNGAVDNDGFIYRDSAKTIISAYVGKGGNVIIPNAVTAIGYCAFTYCEDITSIIIPNSVKSIGDEAFSYCNDLMVICLANTPPRLKYGDNYTFGNIKFTAIYVPRQSVEAYKNAYASGTKEVQAFDTLSVSNNGIAISFALSDSLVVMAIPDTGSHFERWSDGGTQNPRKIAVNSQLEITAIFEKGRNNGNEQSGENQGGNNEGNENQGGENTNPGTAVAESAANAINIYAHGNTIIVENATEEIRVYNAMGALVDRDVACRVRAELQVNGAGVYIVKVGNVAKRVMVY